jgi:hypothetical protein
MDAKLISKTHLLNTFFYLWSRFLSFASKKKFKNSANVTKQIKNKIHETTRKNENPIFMNVMNFYEFN